MTEAPERHDPDETERFIQEQEHVLFPDKSRSFYRHTDCRVCGPGPLKDGEVPSSFPHVFYRMEQVLHEGYHNSWYEDVRTACGPDLADVVSSEIKGSPRLHTIMLDVDLPVRAMPSGTRDHYHLYIDKALTWRQYKKLLRALAKAGVIERGYYRMSLKRHATHLRPPWKKKR